MFADRLPMWVEFVFVRMEEPYIWHQQFFSAEFGNRNRISKQMQHRILLSDWGHDRYWSSIISSCQPSAVWSNRHDDLEVGTSFLGDYMGFLQRQLDKSFKCKGEAFWKCRNLGNLNVPSYPYCAFRFCFLSGSPPWSHVIFHCRTWGQIIYFLCFLCFLCFLGLSQKGPKWVAAQHLQPFFLWCAGCPRGSDEQLGRRNPTDKVSYIQRFGHVLHVSRIVSPCKNI